MTKARSEISVCLSKFWVFKKQLRTALFAPFTLPRYNTPCLPPKAPHHPAKECFSISPRYYSRPKKKEKTILMQNFGR